MKNVNGADLWFIGDKPVGMPGAYSAAGHTGSFPDMRKTYADIPPAMYDAKARLAFMDEEQLWANVLYPNVGGFGAGGFLKHRRPRARARVRARLQRLALRVVRRGPPPPRAGDGDAVLGRAGGRRGDRALRRDAATAPSSSATSRRTTASPRCATRTGIRSGPRRQAAGMSVSFHVGGGDLGGQAMNAGAHRHQGELRAHLDARVPRQRALPRRPDPVAASRIASRACRSCPWRAASAGSRSCSRRSTGSGRTTA